MKRNNIVVVLAALAMLALTGCTAVASASVPTDTPTTSTPSASATSVPPIATPTTGTSGDTSVGTNDGQTVTVPWVSGSIVSDGDTRNSVTMPSIHKLMPGCGVLKTWGDLVACVDLNHAQWYIDGINRYAARSGFNWDDVMKWATAKTIDGKTPEARIIMLTGTMRSLSDSEANDRVKALTDNVTLQVWKLEQSGYTNTWRAGSETKPDMGVFVDYNSEVRVSLVPLVLDANGNVTNLNTKLRFSGVEADCYNDHWLDVITPPTPSVVVCPPGSLFAGQPLPSNGYAGCNPTPSTPPTTSNAKNPKDSVGAVQGTTPLSQTKPITDGKTSANQKAVGDTSGNVTDNTVASNTSSGTTTTDLGSSSGTAAGAKPGGDSTVGTTSGTGQTSTNTGGTSGGTVITDPNLP